MSENLILQREALSVADMADNAINSLLNGEVDPMTAFHNIGKMKKAIELFEKNEQVRDCIMKEFDKYGEKVVSIGDCKMERCEVGTKYDFSECGNPKYERLTLRLEEAKQAVKEQEDMMKSIKQPIEVVDSETGEIYFMRPPIKTSKTWIKQTFNKK